LVLLQRRRQQLQRLFQVFCYKESNGLLNLKPFTFFFILLLWIIVKCSL
jgi:hypothetical protein